MSRKYDIVVFGATGFTGQHTVEEMARIAEEESLEWAISGRNITKLQGVISKASERTGKRLDDVPIIISDINSSESLVTMAQQTKIVLNCVGPYLLFGEQVVKACIEAGTHHLDVSGEPQYLEKMQLLYNAKAKENGVFIIGAAAFDSVPADMGVLHMRQQFGEGELTNVEAVLNTQHGPEGGALNTGTMESAMCAIANASEVEKLRRSLFPEPLPKLDYYLPKRLPFTYSKETKKWVLPFPGTDESVVNRTVRELLANGRLEKPIEFVTYIGCQRYVNVVKLVAFAASFSVFSYFRIGRYLFSKYPDTLSSGFFKSEGPSQKQINESTFTMEFIGYGFSEESKGSGSKKPDKIIQTKISGPDLGYGATPICLIQCAVTLLKSRDKIRQKGGVLTPGSVFIDTDLIARLDRHGVKFSTVATGAGTDADTDTGNK
ncbi:saccharopine dehydrogenase-like oxidoreductase [Aplysia californica]|uniref:Saccharopine dehydrogenase-like oxidoreductase n=1 Tax=Aplysia californica TaxID=6500 RepID=A0ABM0JT85_APLCA|nr:saccharopine dehydrogenase-like oxidoreductase [Aplysia californica]XP_035826297.1 saccharopine dehydrogenase-like oxidoreductase [Aplysia californica]